MPFEGGHIGGSKQDREDKKGGWRPTAHATSNWTNRAAIFSPTHFQRSQRHMDATLICNQSFQSRDTDTFMHDTVCNFWLFIGQTTTE